MNYGDKYRNSFFSYSEIASAGHDEAQLPQLMQASASITRLSSFSEIAPTGHSGSQEPQFTHWSPLIL